MLVWRLRREGGVRAGCRFVYDFRLMGRDEDGCVLACVFLAPAEKVLGYVRVLERARVFPQEVTLSTQGLVDGVSQVSPEEERRSILYVGPDGYEYCVAQGGVPVFSRTFRVVGSLRERPAYLLREIKISHELFRRFKRVPDDMFRGLHVVGRLGSPEAALLAPYVKGLCDADAVFSSAIGRSGRAGKAHIDMMPLALKHRLRRKVLWRRGLRWFVVGYCLVWACFFFCWFGIVWNAEAISVARGVRHRARSDVRAFTAWAHRRIIWNAAWGPAGLSGALDTVLQSLPEGVVLSQIKGRRHAFVLSGLAPDTGAVLDLRRSLSSSPCFAGATLDLLKYEGTGEGQRFRLRCVLKKQGGV